jgi:hypothetical protein
MVCYQLDKTLGLYFANGCGGAPAFRSAYKSKGSSGHCVIEAIRLLESRLSGLGQSELPDEGGTRASRRLAQHEFRSSRTAIDCRHCWKIPLTAAGAVPAITTRQRVPCHHMIRGSEIRVEPDYKSPSRRRRRRLLRTGRGRWSVKSVTSGLRGGQYVAGDPETERRIGEDQKPAARGWKG